MSRNILKYLQRKSKERLYRQWVEKAELAPEQIPPDVLGEQSAEEAELAAEDIRRMGEPGYTASIDVDRRMVRLPLRYVLIGLSIIASLLVVLSVVITILIMRS